VRPQTKSENMSVSGSVRPTVIIFILVLVVGNFACLHWATKEAAPEIIHVKAYFDKYSVEATECICKDPVIREIPKSRSIEEAAVLALKELVKGPSEEEYAQGYRGCLPSGGTIARYKEWYMKIVKAYHEQGGKIDYFGKKFLSPESEFTPWGDKIMVRSVRIENGIAYADFSKELYSYGGGLCFAEAIETSIENTLKQFPQVTKVIILVEGREAEIEP